VNDAPVVVLIHGLGLARGVTWRAIAPALAGRYRVLSYDLPGHGETAPPEGPVTLTALGKPLDITQPLSVAEGKGWREMVVTGECLAEMGGEITVASEDEMVLKIGQITRDPAAATTECSF